MRQLITIKKIARKLSLRGGFTVFRKNSAERCGGFTLIEVLVSVALIGVLVAMSAAIFINTVRNAKKAGINNEARQNAALVIDQLEKDVHLSQAIKVLAGGSTLEITAPTGSAIDYICVNKTPTTNGYIRRNPKAGPISTITNKDSISGVSVENCLFTPIIGSSTAVTMSFTMREGVGVQSASQEYYVNLPFSTTVSIPFGN